MISCINSAQNEVKSTDDTNKSSPIINIGGTYSFGNDVEKGPVGELLVYPKTDSLALFHLNVNRGAPSYNMGLLSGEMSLNNNIGIYISKENACKIQFLFQKGRIDVKTLSGDAADCGFGYGVFADHAYNLINSNIPSYYIGGEGDTIYFKDLKF